MSVLDNQWGNIDSYNMNTSISKAWEHVLLFNFFPPPSGNLLLLCRLSVLIKLDLKITCKKARLPVCKCLTNKLCINNIRRAKQKGNIPKEAYNGCINRITVSRGLEGLSFKDTTGEASRGPRYVGKVHKEVLIYLERGEGVSYFCERV